MCGSSKYSRCGPRVVISRSRGDETVDLLHGGADTERRANRARDLLVLAAPEPFANGVRLGDADAEEMGDVRVRAEASVAHADRILRAQHRRDERMVHAVHREGADTETVHVGAVPETKPVQRRKVVDLSVEICEQSLLMRADVRHAGALERGARCAERDRADDVRTARLVTIREYRTTARHRW